jgi:phenylacetate-CoA ligase
MVVIRGVNVFPSSIDAIVRRVAGDAEYRVTQCHQAAMADLRVEIESPADNSAGGDDLAGRLATAFREHLGLRIAVVAVEPASLPRFEAKARRWVRETDQKSAK